MAEANWIYGSYNTFYSRTGGTGAAAAVVLQPGPNETLEIHGISSATATSLFATNATVTNLLAAAETVASLFATVATIGSLNANSVTSKPIFVTIVQANHGFGVGYWLYVNGSGVYVLADATSVPTAEVVGVVSSVINVNSFILQTTGYVTGLSGLTAGSCYFLSITPGSIGGLTTSIGNVNKPLLVADGAGSGYFTNYRGELLVAPAQIQTIGALYISSSLTVAASTASTSTATGALIVAGGIGAATAVLQSGTVGALVATAATVTNLTVTAGATATNLVVTASTVTGLVATNENIVSSTISGGLRITAATASTSTATGALVITGGLGVGGVINSGNGKFLQTMTAGQTLTTGISVYNFTTSVINTFGANATFASSNALFNTSGTTMYVMAGYNVAFLNVPNQVDVEGWLYINNAGNQYAHDVYVNGATTADATVTGSCLIKLNNGDYLQVANFVSSTLTVNNSVGRLGQFYVYQLP